MEEIHQTGAGRATGSMVPSKRTLQIPQPHTESNKRRAPYVQQACYACRKRKGRCDGRRPCSYCESRPHECVYSDPTSQLPLSRKGWPPPASDQTANVAKPGSRSNVEIDTAAYVHRETPVIHHSADERSSSASETRDKSPFPQVPVSNSVANSAPSTRQINYSRAKSQSQHSKAGRPSTSSSRNTDASERPRRRYFHGPTSPGYSFCAVQRQFEEETRNDSETASNPISISQYDAPDFDESGSDHGSVLSDKFNHHATNAAGIVKPSSHPILYQALDLIRENECCRLLRVYHQAFGHLHPICNVEHLKSEACRLQGATSSVDVFQQGRNLESFEAEENDLLMLNMALAIAMTAESTSEISEATTLYENCRDLIIAKAAKGVSCVKDVIVTMMMGFYYFFRGKRRLAWRMCGLAGRMAMELGLHSQNDARQYCGNQEQEDELATISCTILVLDRQWSAGTGLPANFKETDFDMAKVARASTPYLREMMKFTLISHKFNEPISQVARGESLDQTQIEIVDFQVEQWRKRALEPHTYIHPNDWGPPSQENMPPPWMNILYLRANAVRIILIRPFFLSNTNFQAAAEQVGPGLDLISDSLNILSILDRRTDAYRLMHPNFQHFVASSCALLVLIILFMKQHGSILPRVSVASYFNHVQRNFEIALKLSAKYQHSSRDSRKLWQYLQNIGEPLFTWGVLQGPSLRHYLLGSSSSDPSGDVPPSDLKAKRPLLSLDTPIQTQPEKDKIYTGNWIQQQQQKHQRQRHSKPDEATARTVKDKSHFEHDDTNQQDFQNSGLPISSDFNFETFESLITGWPIGTEGIFFSDGILGG